MAYRFQHRRDLESAWENVRLADGEIGIIQKEENGIRINTNMYKIGDGKTEFQDLPLFGFDGTLSDNLEEVENSSPENEAVSKRTLMTKFASLEETIEGLTPQTTTNAIQSTVEGHTAAIEKNVADISTNTTAIATNAAAIEKNVTDIATNATNIKKNDDAIKTLQSKHQVMSKSDWNDGAYAVDDTFYYIYEEETN